jgi:hypothetical protein
MPKSEFPTLLIPPPEETIDRKDALAWLTNTLPGYETLVAHLSRRLLEELEKDSSLSDKLAQVQFRASALYLLQRDVQMITWACASVLRGVTSVFIEQEPEMENIEGFRGSVVSALRLLVAEAGVVDPASKTFLELSTALGRWQARESDASLG